MAEATTGRRIGPILITRNLQIDDWPAFWPLLRAMGTDDDEGTAEARYGRLLGDPAWGILGALDGGRLVGYAAVQDYGTHLRIGDLHRMARLHDLYVDPVARGQGVGRALMSAVEGWASGRVRYVVWQARRGTSAGFYERLGYRGEAVPQPDYLTFTLEGRR
ncbi:GNAT family N-acetyltransferase [Kribbella sp. NBC_01505]